MVALVAYPFVFSSNHGSAVGSGSPAPTGGGNHPSASPSAVVSASSGFAFQRYPVQAGDYLQKIATKYNLQQWEILMANPILQGNPNHIEVGQILNIPPAGYFGTQPPASAAPSA